jgi:hypothetical protein
MQPGTVEDISSDVLIVASMTQNLFTILDNGKDCEAYNATTSAEQDDEDGGSFVCGKKSRKRNRRQFEDHVAYSEGTGCR